jgi:hypothetical protein
MTDCSGHDCWHELFNNKCGDPYHLIHNLQERLKNTDTVRVEVNMFNMSMIVVLIPHLEIEYPNIKTAIIYRTKHKFLDPDYGIRQKRSAFNNWIENINYQSKIDVKFENLEISKCEKSELPVEYHKKLLDRVGNFYWRYEPNNMQRYLDTAPNNPYFEMYQTINNHIKHFKISDFHEMIKIQSQHVYAEEEKHGWIL